MNRFFRGGSEDDAEEQVPPVVPMRNKPLSREEERLMFEGSVHWGRGLAILLGMAGVAVVFLIVLTVLPKPGTGNPLDALTNIVNTSGSAPLIAPGSATPAVRLATVGPATPAAASSTGTPGPQWVGVAPSGAPHQATTGAPLARWHIRQ